MAVIYIQLGKISQIPVNYEYIFMASLIQLTHFATMQLVHMAAWTAHCDLVTPYGDIGGSIDSGNGFLFHDTKPLPEPMLNHHH